jgi:iron(III) transport system substrate-binding protein
MRGTRLALVLILWAIAGIAVAFEIEDRRTYPGTSAGPVLRVISTADRDVFEPIIRAFQSANPDVTVDYTITGTTELMRALSEEGAGFDLAISSAMDLQTKLANDGFAREYRSAATDGLPEWARWRSRLFAFTQEPAVLVIALADFEAITVPRTRDDLIAVLREHPDRFQGRIGTYDVRSSGFGYLMATQDSRQSEAFWRLMEVMGRLDAQLYCCSGDMIRDVASGRLAMAYNVLGSYARQQLEGTPGIGIIELEDFVNVMLRTALIPASAKNPATAGRFIDFLAGLGRRPDLARVTGLPPIDDRLLQSNSALRPIRFGPGLLVFLDRLKQRNFLRAWTSSLEQDAGADAREP